MLRRIFVYGILAVAGVGVISMAGVLRNRATVQAETAQAEAVESDEGASYAFANDTACCASAKCAGASPCCAGTKCATSMATAACTEEPNVLACTAVETEEGTCRAIQFNGQTIVGFTVADEDDLSQRPCGIDLMAVDPSLPVTGNNAFGPYAARNFQHLVLAVDPSQSNPVDRQLQVVQKLLSTKAELAPSEAQIKAAIDNYFLVNKVESAISMLTKIAAEAPQSDQGKRAKAAIDVLRATDSVRPASYERRGTDKSQEAASPIPEPPVPMP